MVSPIVSKNASGLRLAQCRSIGGIVCNYLDMKDVVGGCVPERESRLLRISVRLVCVRVRIE